MTHFVYHFKNDLNKKDLTPEVLDRIGVGQMMAGVEYFMALPTVTIYDESEESARKQFKAIFERDAGKLIERKNW